MFLSLSFAIPGEPMGLVRIVYHLTAGMAVCLSDYSLQGGAVGGGCSGWGQYYIVN